MDEETKKRLDETIAKKSRLISEKKSKYSRQHSINKEKIYEFKKSKIDILIDDFSRYLEQKGIKHCVIKEDQWGEHEALSTKFCIGSDHTTLDLFTKRIDVSVRFGYDESYEHEADVIASMNKQIYLETHCYYWKNDELESTGNGNLYFKDKNSDYVKSYRIVKEETLKSFPDAKEEFPGSIKVFTELILYDEYDQAKVTALISKLIEFYCEYIA